MTPLVPSTSRARRLVIIYKPYNSADEERKTTMSMWRDQAFNFGILVTEDVGMQVQRTTKKARLLSAKRSTWRSRRSRTSRTSTGNTSKNCEVSRRRFSIVRSSSTSVDNDWSKVNQTFVDYKMLQKQTFEGEKTQSFFLRRSRLNNCNWNLRGRCKDLECLNLKPF